MQETSLQSDTRVDAARCTPMAQDRSLDALKLESGPAAILGCIPTVLIAGAGHPKSTVTAAWLPGFAGYSGA
jgi:hypothetical protein